MALIKMAGALFRGQSTPRDVPVGPSGTPTWHLQVSDLGPRRRHTPKTRVPACRTLRQATRRFLLSRPPQNKRRDEAGLVLERSSGPGHPARARGVGERLGRNERRAGDGLGGGARIDSTHRGGRASNGKAGNEGHGRGGFGADRHFPGNFLDGCSKFLFTFTHPPPRGRKGSAWATSGGSVWIWKSTPLSPSKSRLENEPQGWPISRLTSA